jgi:predicted metal-dependent hydrolase
MTFGRVIANPPFSLSKWVKILLIMTNLATPHSVVDYVVVHELCHMVYHDHSKQFWKLLETVLPNYAGRKDWLKVNGKRMDI